MANTYTLIEAKTLSADTAAINFTSIPQTYTDLQLLCSHRMDASGNSDVFYVRFNSSASTYRARGMYKDSVTVSAQGYGASSGAWAGIIGGASMTSDTFGSASIYIPSYTNSQTKGYSVDWTTETNSNTQWMGLNALLWDGTSAINEINITTTGTNKFITKSTFYLYGIKSS
jgi:hypothetical protein